MFVIRDHVRKKLTRKASRPEPFSRSLLLQMTQWWKRAELCRSNFLAEPSLTQTAEYQGQMRLTEDVILVFGFNLFPPWYFWLFFKRSVLWRQWPIGEGSSRQEVLWQDWLHNSGITLKETTTLFSSFLPVLVKIFWTYTILLGVIYQTSQWWKPHMVKHEG